MEHFYVAFMSGSATASANWLATLCNQAMFQAPGARHRPFLAFCGCVVLQPPAAGSRVRGFLMAHALVKFDVLSTCLIVQVTLFNLSFPKSLLESGDTHP